MINFAYVVTVHNHGFMIERVLDGIIRNFCHPCCLYTVLDGCTDNSEEVIDKVAKLYDVPIQKIYTPDVHEILSLNTAFRTILNTEADFVITVQDDVILKCPNLEHDIITAYQKYPKLGHIVFRLGANTRVKEDGIEFFDPIENMYSPVCAGDSLPEGHIAFRMIGCKSPSCIPTWLLREIGLLDERLAPCDYDDVEFSLRCLKNGYDTAVLCEKYQSEVEWGGHRIKDQGTAHRNAKHSREMKSWYGEFIESFEIPDYMKGCQPL